MVWHSPLRRLEDTCVLALRGTVDLMGTGKIARTSCKIVQRAFLSRNPECRQIRSRCHQCDAGYQVSTRDR